MKFDKVWLLLLAGSGPFVAGWAVVIFNPWLGIGIAIGSYATLWIAIGLWLSQVNK